MEMDSGAKRTRIAEEEQRDVDDHISRLPDAILGEIVSLLPTKDGGRTRAIASRWRHLWRSAPLNLDLHDRRIPPAQVSGILASHEGPGRRLCVPDHYLEDDDHCAAARLDDWLRSPALHGLQELDFHFHGSRCTCSRLCACIPVPPLPLPLLPSTLRVASFGGCAFPETGLHLPHLLQLSLMSVKISLRPL